MYHQEHIVAYILINMDGVPNILIDHPRIYRMMVNSRWRSHFHEWSRMPTRMSCICLS